MAFKERFKDKTTVVGKTGEGAMLGEKPGAPAKAMTKAQMAANRTSVPMTSPGAPMAPPPGMPGAPMQAPMKAPGKSPGRGNPPGGMSPGAPALGMPPGPGGPMTDMPGAPPPQTLGAKAPPGKKGAKAPPGKQGAVPLGGMPGAPPMAGMPGPPGVGGGMGLPMPGAPASPQGAKPQGKKSQAKAPSPKRTGSVVGFTEDKPSSAEKYDYKAKMDPPKVETPPPEKQRVFGQALPPKYGRRAASNPPAVRPSTDPPKYTPKTLEEWREVQSKPQAHRGGLGPSDTDEQRFYRIMKNKAKEYAKGATRVNMALLAVQEEKNPVPIEKPLTKEQREKNERRLKALEFARNVPKPKSKFEEDSNSNTHNVVDTNMGTLPPRRNTNAEIDDPMLYGQAEGVEPTQDQATQEALNELEAKHARDQEMIENIKKQLKM